MGTLFPVAQWSGDDGRQTLCGSARDNQSRSPILSRGSMIPGHQYGATHVDNSERQLNNASVTVAPVAGKRSTLQTSVAPSALGMATLKQVIPPGSPSPSISPR